jgi:hypothetical protein
MYESTDRLRRSIPICVLGLVALVGCGRYQPPSDPSEAPTTEATAASTGWPITRCADVPPIPHDRNDFAVNRSPVDDPVQTVQFVWMVGKLGPQGESPAYAVRVDDPSCAKRPDIQRWLKVRAEPPRFEDARIVLRPGQDRAYVGYTIIGKGETQYASPGDVRVVGPDGRSIKWKQQTATGGPGDIVAAEGRQANPPATGPGGDAFYIDASAVELGQTITVTFRFHTGDVAVPFKVVAAD